MGDHGVLSRCPSLRGRSPLAALEPIADEGVTDVILLALTQVGTGAGPDIATLRAARAAFPRLRLIAGGGVRDAEDLRRLAASGADGVLLATALHRRWITAAEIGAAGWPGARSPSSHECGHVAEHAALSQADEERSPHDVGRRAGVECMSLVSELAGEGVEPAAPRSAEIPPAAKTRAARRETSSATAGPFLRAISESGSRRGW